MDPRVVIGVGMVLVGAGALAYAIARTKAITARVETADQKRDWSVLRLWMSLFFAAYLSIAALLVVGIGDWVVVLVGLVFLGGGAFAARVTAATDRTIMALSEARARERRARAYTEKARAQRNAAVQASAQKSSFLATMSHELRTPLNAIIGYAELAGEELGDTDQARLVADQVRIEQAGRHLLSLIDDILDLSKIEAGRLQVTCEDFDADALMHDVCETVEQLARANGNTFVFECHRPLGEVISDPLRLKQCLLNLLGNACKFAEDGEVRLEVHRDHEQVQFTVVDTGIGMSEGQLDRVFEAFSQADESTTRAYGGTGLGLTLTRRFATMMGGTVDVYSAPGEGTRFVLRIPDANLTAW